MTNASDLRCQERPLRILVLEPEPRHGGGSEAVVLALARGLAQRGHECVLLHDAAGSMLADYAAIARRVQRAPLAPFAFRRPVASARTLSELVRAAMRNRTDVMLSSHLGYLVTAAALRTVAGVPSCFHLGLPSVGARTAWRWAYRRLGAGVAPSMHTLSGWEGDGWPRSDLHCIPNGVDPGRFAPHGERAALRRNLGVPEVAPMVTFVGRICAQKGIAVLLGSWPKVRKRVPGAQLMMIGALDPQFTPMFKVALASMDAGDRASVHVREPIERPEHAYAAADVTCVPSIGDESFGLTVLESMACAVPPVASRVGMIDQLLGPDDGGLLVAPGDNDALADRLAHWLLVDEDVRRVSGARLRERAIRQYSVEAMVAEYEGVLRMLGATAGRKT